MIMTPTNCMNNGVGSIVQFSTPTMKITFKQIDPAKIVEAFLVIKDGGEVLLQKPLSDAEVVSTEEEKYIAWTLEQEETGALPLDETVRIYCDWLLEDETRGRSKRAEFTIVDTGVDEVI